jgi:hypothetical protein
MELFGGVGFLEDFPISRLHREALVTAIWEGASNIQALDMLEAIHKKSAHESFLEEFIPMLDGAGETGANLAKQAIESTLSQLSSLSVDEAQWHAKHALSRMADAVQVALLYELARLAGERYAKLAEIYAVRFLSGGAYPSWALDDRQVWWPLVED